MDILGELVGGAGHEVELVQRNVQRREQRLDHTLVVLAAGAQQRKRRLQVVEKRVQVREQYGHLQIWTII